MRQIRLAGFAVLALGAVGVCFVTPSGAGADPRIVALLALLVLVAAWHFATLRRARREDGPTAPPGPVDAPVPSPEDVVDRDAPTTTSPSFHPGAISPTEVLPPEAEVVPPGAGAEQFDLDAPVPGAPEPQEVVPEEQTTDQPLVDAVAEPSLPAPPPEPQYKDGFEKWAAEMFGPRS